MIKNLYCLFFYLTTCASAFAADLRDPTRPLNQVDQPAQAGQPPAAAPVLVLNATLVSNDREVAVINGESFQVGDAIAGSYILVIDPNTVQLVGVDGKITLFLVEQQVKSSVKNKSIN